MIQIVSTILELSRSINYLTNAIREMSELKKSEQIAQIKHDVSKSLKNLEGSTNDEQIKKNLRDLATNLFK